MQASTGTTFITPAAKDNCFKTIYVIFLIFPLKTFPYFNLFEMHIVY